MVCEADIIKVVERMRHALASRSGDSPSSFKRKRAVYRALDRKEPNICDLFNHEMVMTGLCNSIVQDMFGPALNTYLPGTLLKGLSEFLS